MINRKRKILTIEVMYSNQAKILLGRAKIKRTMTRKMVTGEGALSAKNYVSRAGPGLTRCSKRESSSSPVLNENVEEYGFQCHHCDPS